MLFRDSIRAANDSIPYVAHQVEEVRSKYCMLFRVSGSEGVDWCCAPD